MQKHKPTLEHAKHNEAACRHLLKTNEYPDWIITTAYYSAIYYVCFELFPNQYDIAGRPTQCHNFADYYAKLPRPKDSKHSVREDLVNEYIPEVYTAFATLREMCSTARYKNYKITDEEVKLAVQCLDEIKEVCDSNI